jgi:hypothetical protein
VRNVYGNANNSCTGTTCSAHIVFLLASNSWHDTMPSMTKMENFDDTAHETNSDAILTPLGSGGWIPIEYRHTACYVFQKGGLLVILDFGTGISRLISEHDYLLSAF